MRTNRRRFPAKTKNETKVYGIDWRSEVKGDSISSVAWSSNKGGLTFSDSTILGTQTKITIAGGSDNTEYVVTAKITKSTGEICEAPLWLRVNPSDEVA